MVKYSNTLQEEDSVVEATADSCLECKSIRLFFGNTLLWTSTLHLLINILMIEFITILLRFSVPRTHTDGPVNRDTFCDGLFTSLVELQAISDGVRLLGSFLYAILSLRTNGTAIKR